VVGKRLKALRIAKRTKTLYQRHVKAFGSWLDLQGHSMEELERGPPRWDLVSNYLAERVRRRRLKFGTLLVIVSAISYQFEWPSWTTVSEMTKLMQGLRRHLARKKEVKKPLRLRWIWNWNELAKDIQTHTRDMALLTTGIWGALRCDELLRLRWKDIKLRKRSKHVDYAIIKLRRSKTDIDRGGSNISIPRLRSPICPIRWLRRLRRETKPKSKREFIFRSMKRFRIARLVKAVAGAHNRNVHHYSTHSLRRGGITLRAELGFSLPEIQQHARHKNPSTTMAYIHLPSDHALARLQRANRMAKHK